MRTMRGFTLLELLIAIAIFALLGLGTYRMLDSVLQTDKVTRAHELQLRELVRAMAAFERDVLQVQARPSRDPFGDPRAALLGEDLDNPALELTRSGWRNPLGQSRSGLQRVRWQLSGEQWQRQYWTVLDQAQDSQPQVQQALDGVTRVQLRYLDQEGTWQTRWPPLEKNPDEALKVLPQAIELVLQHRRYGDLRRVLRLPEGLPERLQQAPEPNPDEPAEPGGDIPEEPRS
ncbi:type II secretion system minor pseudopilin GspJ [Pseudomonas sp. SL4(2022)]|uniref:type II secretion system minor pseudopilin GspJ n=1 Tax=Pseudomonas sp. SL4(2022) TaxID=2994661 RepID=UPI00226E86DF|nr:type II secretion system minor pseudopilin GspJ [Pseudomonas sp. SL4(2022)]WAC43688.1 type II secretion system minor pseudopilin GspJ [Pseudomonas sp. SL4(2022)]